LRRFKSFDFGLQRGRPRRSIVEFWFLRITLDGKMWISLSLLEVRLRYDCVSPAFDLRFACAALFFGLFVCSGDEHILVAGWDVIGWLRYL
jgi:hypothetical protein